MPIPLRPNGIGYDGSKASEQASGYFSLSPGMLSDFVNLSVPGLMSKEASANDADAATVFSLWQKSTVTKDAPRISERVYDIPSDFNNNQVLRLKASGLLVKKESGVSFTERAEQIIQTMVLSEENSFNKNSVKKPYSVILAETKAPKRSSNLSHTASAVRPEKKDVMRTSGLVSLAMSENVYTIPSDAKPDSSSVYIYDDRVVNTEGGSYKEYNVRVYDNGDGTWDVWAFNGKINGTMVPQPKGRYHNKNSAINQAHAVINSKTSKGYEDAVGHGFSKTNSSLPGKKENPNSPVKAVPKATPPLVKQTPKPQPTPVVDTSKEDLKKKYQEEQAVKSILDTLEEQMGGSDEA